MKRRISIAALLVAFAAPAAADATHYGFPVGIDDPPPLERLELKEPARIVRIEGSDVHAVDDAGCEPDVFRFGLSWYVCTGVHWYRSTSLGGPFRAIDVRYVPRPVLEVPVHRWKRHPLAHRTRRARPAPPVSIAAPVEQGFSLDERGVRPRHPRPRRDPH